MNSRSQQTIQESLSFKSIHRQQKNPTKIDKSISSMVEIIL